MILRRMQTAITTGTSVHLEPGGGRSSSEVLPFFNLEWPRQGGVLFGIGWSGEWAADVEPAKDQGVRFRAGMALTRLKLKPGESIRTPSVAMLSYDGDWIRGQNLWRRFILDQHRPRVHGNPVQSLILAGNWARPRLRRIWPTSRQLQSGNCPLISTGSTPSGSDADRGLRTPEIGMSRTTSIHRDFALSPKRCMPPGGGCFCGSNPSESAATPRGPRSLRRWLLAVPQQHKFYRWGDKQTLPDWHKAESLRNQIQEGDRLWNLRRTGGSEDSSRISFLRRSRNSVWTVTAMTRTSRRWSSGGLPMLPTAGPDGNPLDRGPLRFLGRVAPPPSGPDHR